MAREKRDACPHLAKPHTSCNTGMTQTKLPLMAGRTHLLWRPRGTSTCRPQGLCLEASRRPALLQEDLGLRSRKASGSCGQRGSARIKLVSDKRAAGVGKGVRGTPAVLVSNGHPSPPERKRAKPPTSAPGRSAHPEHTRAEQRMSATAGSRGVRNVERHGTQGRPGRPRDIPAPGGQPVGKK